MRGARLVLLCCAALASCLSSEGGVTGTGVSSSVSGNIRLVNAAAERAELPFPIRVSIEGMPDLTAVTDDEGSFALRGGFSGAIVLTFADASRGASLGGLPLEVPAGSEVILENIEIDPGVPPSERVRPAAVRQLDVFGRLDMVECEGAGAGTVLISDDSAPPHQFLIVLSGETEIAARDGDPLVCDDLEPGMAVRVEGLLRLEDQTTVALLVVTTSARPPRSPGGEPRPERLRGAVVAVDCAAGTVEVEQVVGAEAVSRTVQLFADTEIRCAADPPIECACADIHVGTAVAVSGTISPRRPGVVRAELVTIGQGPLRLELAGRVHRINCADRELTVREERLDEALRVRVSEATVIRCGRQPCACTDLQPDDRVRVEGVRSPFDRRVIEALRITRIPSLDAAPA
ncbi:MAG: hypothetical protein AB7V27_03295 [Candidatus Binatia bacterium]